jgi:hypothetical protein
VGFLLFGLDFSLLLGLSMQSYSPIIPPQMTSTQRDDLTSSGDLPVGCEILNISFTPPRRQTQTDTGVWQDSIAPAQQFTAEQELWLQ